MQINRLFEIVYMLLNKKTVTAQDFAERFEVSKRTVYRDIEILSAAGIPVFMNRGRGGGISLLPDFVLNKAVLTEGEKQGILSALEAMKAISVSESDDALKKLRGVFGEVNTDWIEVEFSPWSGNWDESNKFDVIKNAIFEKKLTSFEYSSGKSERLTREVEPLKLCFKNNAWYLYAYCRYRSDYRFFKLSRIKELKVKPEFFEREVGKRVIQGCNPPIYEWIDFKLRIASQMAFRVYDEFSSYEQTDDGSFLVDVKIPNDDWTIPYLMGFGGYCQVIEPEWMKERLKSELQKMLNYYL